MQKILSAIAFAICISSVNFCSADYYDDSPDYVYVGWAPSIKTYLNLRSVDVQEYNPPHYQIGYKLINITEIPGTNEKKWRYNSKRYNWYTKETFHLENGYWVKDDVTSQTGMAERARYAADVVFRAAYGMNFYGY